jgi:hypothetical protein
MAMAWVRRALPGVPAGRPGVVQGHKFSGMLSAFSTAAGDQAADLEDLATREMLQEALPFVEELDQCATELARLADGLTVETLRKLAEPAGAPNRTANPGDSR